MCLRGGWVGVRVLPKGFEPVFFSFFVALPPPQLNCLEKVRIELYTGLFINNIMYATIRGKHIKTKLANSPLQPAVQTVLCTFQPPGARRPAQIRKWSLIMGGGRYKKGGEGK